MLALHRGSQKHRRESLCSRQGTESHTQGNSGTYFLNFCPDYRQCPFQVVVSPADLRHVGDIRQLEGKIIEVQGDIKEYDGRPEIVLKNSRQLRAEAAPIPRYPENELLRETHRSFASRRMTTGFCWLDPAAP
jgi:hypothetical protein